MGRIRLDLIGLAMGVMGLAACGGPTPEPVQACTLIGCESGLTVRFADGFAEIEAVEVSGPGEATQRVECDADRRCEDGVFFREFLAESVTIRVTTAAGTTTRTAQPRYESVQPNGPGCPPTCRQGEVLVAMGGGGDVVEEDPPLPPATRPGTIVDTIRLEGTPEAMRMRLVHPPEGFPLVFTTYIPEDWETASLSSGEGAAFRMIPGPQWMEGGRMVVRVHPAGSSRSEASALVRSIVTAGGADVQGLADPDPWAVEAHRFRRTEDGQRYTGWLELGRRDGRYFHILVEYPVEMGDGMAPRVGAILEHWRWAPSGDRLGG